MLSKLYLDEPTQRWVYNDKFVQETTRELLEIDLIGAKGEIARWEQRVRKVQLALASLNDLEEDSPTR